MKVSGGYLDQLWSKAVKAKDGYVCRICKKTQGLESHHINGRAHRTTRWDIRNGITLCKGCHDKAGKLLDMQIRELIGHEIYDGQALLASKTLKGYCTELGISPMEFKLKKKVELKDVLTMSTITDKITKEVKI